MDFQYLLLLQQLRELTGGVLDSLLLYITSFGEDLLLFLGAAGIYWSVDKAVGLYILAQYQLGNFANQLLKITFCVNRPWVRDSRIRPVESAKAAATGYSFPSGHTAKAIAVWGGLGHQIYEKSKRISIFLWGLVLLVGFSRNYLGVHTPQDMAVSFVLGIILLYASDKGLKWAEEKPGRNWLAAWTGLGLSAALIIYALVKPYPMEYVEGILLVEPSSMIRGTLKGAGGMCGFCAGWMLEKKAVCFSAKEFPIEEKIWRFLIGAMGLLVLLKTGPNIWTRFWGANTASFMNGFAPSFYMIGGFPWLYFIFDKKSRKG